MSDTLDLVAIREALADAVKLGVAAEINVYAWVPDTAISLPAIVVLPSSDTHVAYHEAFAAGLGSINLQLAIYTQGNVTGQKLMARLLSAGTDAADSIIDAITADRRLGGAVHDCIATQATHQGRIDLSPDGSGQTPAYAATVEVTAWNPRK